MSFDDNTEWSLNSLGKAMLQILQQNNDHNVQMEKIQQESNEMKEKITKLENELKNLKVIVEKNEKKRESESNKIEQRDLSYAIVLKGFNYDFNSETVIENFIRGLKIHGPISKYYKFDVEINKSNKNMRAYYMQIEFTCSSDKDSVFYYLTQNGPIKCEQLDDNCPVNQRENNIHVDHALTKKNLKIQKKLFNIKKSFPKGDFQMRLRKSVYQYKLRQEKQWRMVEELDDLETFMDDVQSSNKRTRNSPNDAAGTPNQKRKY